jgi:hypothetical protein
MKKLVLISLLFAQYAIAAIESPKLSPSLNVYGDAKIVDENSSRQSVTAIILINSLGSTGIPSVDLVPGLTSSVTGLEEKPLYKLADGSKIQVSALVGLDTTAKQLTSFVVPAASLSKIEVYPSIAYAGGASVATVTVSGLSVSDTILAVTQKVQGVNNLPILGWSNQASNALNLHWSADPGANAVVEVLVKHQ